MNNDMNIKHWVKNNIILIILVSVGILGGYLYWRYVGCLSGTCPLKKLWYYDGLLGALIGMFIGDSIQSIIKKRKLKRENNESN